MNQRGGPENERSPVRGDASGVCAPRRRLVLVRSPATINIQSAQINYRLLHDRHDECCAASSFATTPRTRGSRYVIGSDAPRDHEDARRVAAMRYSRRGARVAALGRRTRQCKGWQAIMMIDAV